MEGQRGAGRGSNRWQAPMHCGLGDTNGIRFALVLRHYLERYYFAQFAFSVSKQHALCLHGGPLADHRVHAGVCDIPGQQAARAELSTRPLGLSHRCCSGPHCVCFSLCASQAHQPMLHQSSSTSVAQPADIGVMKPFKDALATACGNFFATTLLDTIRAGGSVVLSDSLAQNRNQKPIWVNEAVLALQNWEKIHLNSWRHIVAHDPAQVLDKARRHYAETLFRCCKRGPLPEGDLQNKAPHEISISILTMGEEEPADEDDSDAMLMREVQEEEGDEADQAIPEDEQPAGPQLSRAQRLLSLRLAHGNASQRVSANGQAPSLIGSLSFCLFDRVSISPSRERATAHAL